MQAFQTWRMGGRRRVERGQKSAFDDLNRAVGFFEGSLLTRYFRTWVVHTWKAARRGERLKKTLEFFGANALRRH